MSNDSAFTQAYVATLQAMDGKGRPMPLNSTAQMLADQGVMVGDDALLAHLAAAGRNDLLAVKVHQALLAWDAVDRTGWPEGTEPHTRERRTLVLRLLEIGEQLGSFLNDRFPVVARDEILIADDDDWQPWYTSEIKAARDFYWNSYKKHLLGGKHWDADAVASVDEATDHIIERLSDPTRPEAFQAKGLVVGHVQSGKTANFTGVVAKAVE